MNAGFSNATGNQLGVLGPEIKNEDRIVTGCCGK